MTTFKAKKQTTLNLNISLPQGLVLSLLNEAEQEQIDLSLHITNKLSSLDDYTRHDIAEALMSQALYCAAHTREGEEFTLKELFNSINADWEDVKSPRSFGRKFKKEILELEIAEVIGKKADNKLIYKRTNIENDDVRSGKYFVDTDLLADGILKQ